jgi:hypothetical protein
MTALQYHNNEVITMKDSSSLLNSLLAASCTPTTPVGEALSKVSRHYGYASQEFQSFLAFVRANSPDSLPAKYVIGGHVKPTVSGKATISGSLSPSVGYNWQAGIDFLARSLDLHNLIPGRFTRLADMVPQS